MIDIILEAYYKHVRKNGILDMKTLHLICAGKFDKLIVSELNSS